MNWKNYFLNMASSVSLKSKDPSSKVGCVIVDKDNRLVSAGYNGHVAKCDEGLVSYDRPMKYFTIIHAEMNALIYARRDLKDCIAYSTHGPCENCLKHLVASGVKEIYYTDSGIMKDRGSEEQKEAIIRLILANNIVVQSFDGKNYILELYKNKSLLKEVLSKIFQQLEVTPISAFYLLDLIAEE